MGSLGNLNNVNSKPVLEVRTQKSELQLSNKRVKFRINNQRPQMSVQRRMPTFKMNYGNMPTESGLANPARMRQDVINKAQSKAMQAIARIAQEGDQFLDPKRDARETVAQIAVNNIQASIPELNIRMSSMPEVEWDNGDFQVVWSQGSFEIEWDPDFMPDINFTPHSVEIKIRNYPKVKAGEPEKVRESNIDKKI